MPMKKSARAASTLLKTKRSYTPTASTVPLAPKLKQPKAMLT